MDDNKLEFDRSCHVLYSKDCKKEIKSKIGDELLKDIWDKTTDISVF